MFEQIVNAAKPYAFITVVLAGLSLAGKFPIASNVILGFVVAGIGVALCLLHAKEEIQKASKKGK
jgi:hypothetical protein